MNYEQNDIKAQEDIVSINNLSSNSEVICSNMPNSTPSKPDYLSAIDPIWISILTIYASKDRTVPKNILIQKLSTEISSSSVDRYLQFMHQSNLVETTENPDSEDRHSLTLTTRGIRLVQEGLRLHG